MPIDGVKARDGDLSCVILRSRLSTAAFSLPLLLLLLLRRCWSSARHTQPSFYILWDCGD